MKKMLVVAFCMLIGTTLSAQEGEKVVGEVQDAAAEIIEAPVADSDIVKAPQEGEAPAPVEESEIEIESEAADAPIAEGTVQAMPATDAPVMPGVTMGGSPCTGCGQATPIMNYNPCTTYTPAITYTQAAPCCETPVAAEPCCGTPVAAEPCCGTPMPAEPCYGSSVVAAPPAPATYCCCPTTNRPRFRMRRASRRNPCCY